jgi:homoserine dehydrogenase
VGLVGKEVVKQLSTNPALAERIRIDVLSNSKYAVVVPATSEEVEAFELLQALPPSSAAKAPPASSAKFQVAPYAVKELMKMLVERSSAGPMVCVDCTSDNGVAASYPALLAAGIHVVTPNKKAFSGSQKLYDGIQAAAESGHSMLYQEATVGAGLPIISTLKDLLATGDRIHKVEGVLSGTMSYIFNNFSKPGSEPAPKFSEVVKIAKDNGYTVRRVL